jgi:hypothetical protein
MYTSRPVITLTAAEDLAANRLVKLNSSDPGKVEYVDELGEAYGITTRPADEGQGVPVAPLRTAICEEMTASEAVAKGAKVYPADDGKIADLSATVGDHTAVGLAREAATAADDVITIQIIEPEVSTVSE